MEAEKIDLSKGYCPLFLARGMSTGDCIHGDPKDYKTCDNFKKYEERNKKWENSIPEIRYGRKRI